MNEPVASALNCAQERVKDALENLMTLQEKIEFLNKVSTIVGDRANISSYKPFHAVMSLTNQVGYTYRDNPELFRILDELEDFGFVTIRTDDAPEEFYRVYTLRHPNEIEVSIYVWLVEDESSVCKRVLVGYESKEVAVSHKEVVEKPIYKFEC